MVLQALPVLDPVPLMEEVHGRLLLLLRDLRPREWALPTVARKWCVKDIAAHLLDGQIRRLSTQRDHWSPPPPAGGINGYADLVAYLNELNRTWVEAARRMSPGVLIELLEWSGAALFGMLKAVDLESPALFPVAWAGESRSTLRFDLARELTEIWLHQQQIRLATDRPPLFEARLLHPVMDAFMQAMPHTYRDCDAVEGTSIGVKICGDAPRNYGLMKESAGWRLGLVDLEPVGVSIQMDPGTAWLLFSKGLSREEALARIQITGDARLAEPLLGMVSVMA